MRLAKVCGRFCSWFGRCLNQHEGECLGYVEPEDDDKTEDLIDKMAY